MESKAKPDAQIPLALQQRFMEHGKKEMYAFQIYRTMLEVYIRDVKVAANVTADDIMERFKNAAMNSVKAADLFLEEIGKVAPKV